MKESDILIIGGGPAGLGAALTATNAGVKVLMLDENNILGGQLIKQTHKFFGSEKQYAGIRGIKIADYLMKDIKEEKMEVWLNTSVIGIFDDGIVGYVKGEEIYGKIKAKKVIIATGAQEKMITFPNNDLPGVYGAGGVQTLMNVYGIAPGNKVIMIGAGNIGLIVSYQLIQAGVEVAAIVEALNRVGGYQVHHHKIKRLGVPIYLRHSVKEVYGDEHLKGIIIAELDENWNFINGTEKEFVVDTVCLAVGLSPTSELLWQGNCEMVYCAELGGYVAKHDKFMRTTNPDIFVVGDCSGIAEASTAMIEGQIAGIEVSKELGFTTKNYEGVLCDCFEQLD
jgi:sarcosine oxidase subunit alpha